MIIDLGYENELSTILKDLKSIEIFSNGEIKKIEKGNKDFNIIRNKLEQIFSSARVEPAFGVSLHNETLNELKKDNWIKLNFTSIQSINELPFNSLLFKLEEQTLGFNLIREQNSNYDGRCIFLVLNQITNLFDLFKIA